MNAGRLILGGFLLLGLVLIGLAVIPLGVRRSALVARAVWPYQLDLALCGLAIFVGVLVVWSIASFGP